MFTVKEPQRLPHTFIDKGLFCGVAVGTVAQRCETDRNIEGDKWSGSKRKKETFLLLFKLSLMNSKSLISDCKGQTYSKLPNKCHMQSGWVKTIKSQEEDLSG